MLHKHSHETYKTHLEAIRKNLNPFERIVSKLIHQKPVESALNLLERTVFHVTAMLFGLVLVITAGAGALLIAGTFNYQVHSLSALGVIFLLGFTIGHIYTLIRHL